MKRSFSAALWALILPALSIFAIPAFSQEGSTLSPLNAATPKLDVDEYRRLDYRIEPTTDGVTAAWIEVWDRPKLLSRISVPIRGHGQVQWRDGVERTPERLYVALRDPDAPMGCVDNCNYSAAEWAALRRDTSRADLMVGKSPEGEWEPPKLDSAFFRVLVGNGDRSFILRGRYFTTDTQVRLVEEDPGTGIWHWGDRCQSEFIHPWEIRVTVSGRSLTFGHRLAFRLEDNVDEASAGDVDLSQPIATLTVACSDSPVLDSVEPAKLSADAADKGDVPVKLRGRGFDSHSTLMREWWPVDYTGREPVAQSSQELQVMVGWPELRAAITDGQELRLFVKDSSDPCRLSESKAIEVLPTDTLRAYPAGKILTALPYPVPLMDAYSAEVMELQIIGEHFRANDTAVAYTDDYHSETKLSTQFVSSGELRAELPRELWRTHRLSYRFVISTRAGDRAVEIVEPD
jgi:hypothetical protein